MKFRVIVLPQARGNIDRNADWWAQQHPVDQALRWSDAIYDQIETLADFPESHSLSAENDDFPNEIRDKLVGSRPTYRAVLTIKDDTVFVLTVRHSAQDVLCPGDVESPPSA